MVFNYAIDDKIISESPVNIRLAPEEDSARDRVWTEQEREKLFMVLHRINVCNLLYCCVLNGNCSKVDHLIDDRIFNTICFEKE
jgi:hypothetical protein